MATTGAMRLGQPCRSSPVVRGSRLSSAARPVALRAAATQDAVIQKGVESGVFVDEAKLLSASTFPIGAEDLIKKTKEYLAASAASGSPGGLVEALDENYKFIGPVVGPLGKAEFVKAVSTFNFQRGFPDLASNFFGFHVDPMETNRVWFMSRSRGTNTGQFASFEPSGKKYEGPPELLSLTWTAEGTIIKQTVGCVGDRTQGNTGGLGAAFGMFYAIGKGLPFPEAQPFSPSWRYAFFQNLNRALSYFGGSKEADKPASSS